MTTKRKTHYNTGFASGGVMCKLGELCFYSSSMQIESFLLRKLTRTQKPKTDEFHHATKNRFKKTPDLQLENLAIARIVFASMTSSNPPIKKIFALHTSFFC